MFPVLVHSQCPRSFLYKCLSSYSLGASYCACHSVLTASALRHLPWAEHTSPAGAPDRPADMAQGAARLSPERSVLGRDRNQAQELHSLLPFSLLSLLSFYHFFFLSKYFSLENGISQFLMLNNHNEKYHNNSCSFFLIYCFCYTKIYIYIEKDF